MYNDWVEHDDDKLSNIRQKKDIVQWYYDEKQRSGREFLTASEYAEYMRDLTRAEHEELINILYLLVLRLIVNVLLDIRNAQTFLVQLRLLQMMRD